MLNGISEEKEKKHIEQEEKAKRKKAKNNINKYLEKWGTKRFQHPTWVPAHEKQQTNSLILLFYSIFMLVSSLFQLGSDILCIHKHTRVRE